MIGSNTLMKFNLDKAYITHYNNSTENYVRFYYEQGDLHPLVQERVRPLVAGEQTYFYSRSYLTLWGNSFVNDDWEKSVEQKKCWYYNKIGLTNDLF